MNGRKGFALAFVLVFLTASCVIVIKPVFGESSVVGNTWVEKAPMQVARANLGVAVVNGDIYAIGGNTVTGEYNFDQGFSYGINGSPVNTNEQYDPSTNSWTFKAPMPTLRDSFAIAIYKDNIYCIGGRISIPYVQGITENAITEVNEVYNTLNNTWHERASSLLNYFD